MRWVFLLFVGLAAAECFDSTQDHRRVFERGKMTLGRDSMPSVPQTVISLRRGCSNSPCEDTAP